MKLLLSCSVALCAGMLLSETVDAHGGRYRGPGDVVDPSGGGRGGRSGGPGGPTTGGPSGPTQPGPTGSGSRPGATGGGGAPGVPGPGGATTRGGGGGGLSDDLTRWVYWWELNKDPYLMLKAKVHSPEVRTGSDDHWLGVRSRKFSDDTLRPTEHDLMNRVVPALKRALDDAGPQDNDVVSSCLVALAKVGEDHRDFALVDVFAERLAANNQETRESAALALGIAGETTAMPRQLELLRDLVADNSAGRKASGGSSVNERTRAFAAYAIGLAAHSTGDVALKRQAFDTLSPILGRAVERSGRNLRVAAIHGLSLLRLNPSRPEESKLLDETVDLLADYYRRDIGVGDQLVQAHCPTAIAKLLGRDHPRADDFRALFREGLAGRLGQQKRRSHDLRRSCALALGQLGQVSDTDLAAQLVTTYQKDRDAQTRNFAVLALGQIGGKANRKQVLRLLANANGIEKPWCALALGVLAHADYEQQKQAKNTIDADAGLGAILFDEFRSTKNPSVKGAIAIALGLARYVDAADTMRELMLSTQQKEEMGGYLAIGLSLMNDLASREALRDIIHSSTRRPLLLNQAAVALGKIGDKRAARDLVAMLEDSDSNLARLSSLSSALGFIGDRGSIEPLVRLLGDRDINQLSRAFAAVALGGVGDKELLPWGSKIAVNTNYRANTATLTDGVTGILDIL